MKSHSLDWARWKIEQMKEIRVCVFTHADDKKKYRNYDWSKLHTYQINNYWYIYITWTEPTSKHCIPKIILSKTIMKIRLVQYVWCYNKLNGKWNNALLRENQPFYKFIFSSSFIKLIKFFQKRMSWFQKFCFFFHSRSSEKIIVYFCKWLFKKSIFSRNRKRERESEKHNWVIVHVWRLIVLPKMVLIVIAVIVAICNSSE